MQQPKSLAQKRVEALLRAADRDVEMAETAERYSPHLYENIGFNCQQAVEKYAKCVLMANGFPAPFTHVLVKLLSPLLQNAIIRLDPDEIDAAAILQDFAVEWRYETDSSPSYASADLLAMALQFRKKLRPLAVAFLV